MQLLTAFIGMVGGIAGALSGVWIQGRMAAKHVRVSSLLQERIRLYSDALMLARRVENWTERLSDELRGYTRNRPDLPLWEKTTGAMQLVAPLTVRSAWLDLAEANKAMWLRLDLKRNIVEGQAVAEETVDVRRALGALREAIERDVIHLGIRESFGL